MAGIDINVRMAGGGKPGVSSNMSRAKSTLSAKDSITINKAIKKATNLGIGAATFGSTGDVPRSVIMSVPVLRELKILSKVADKGIDIYTKIKQAHSGEDMLLSNFKARYKTARSLGTNIFSGYVQNLLYTRPQIRRQNNMLDYGREIYLRNVENEKNQFV
jgi:hypothetical protein